MPEVQHPVRSSAEEPGPEHDIGDAPFQRLEQHLVLAGVVLEVGVLDDDVVAGDDRERAAQRRPLAAVALVGDDGQPRIVQLGDEVGEHLGRAVGRAVVDDDDLGRPR